MKWPRVSAPNHPEYGAQALLMTSVRPFIVTVWTEHASSVERVEDDGWTSGALTFGHLEALAPELENLGVPADEAATLAADVASQWQERWRARESEVRWPVFELWFYGVAAAIVVPAVAGGAAVLAETAQMLVRRRGLKETH